MSRQEGGLTPRACAVAVGTITFLAAVLRVINLDGGLWYDEIVTIVESVRPPLATIVTEFPGSNNHPLYSLLAHVSVASFGEAAWSVRLPAVVFGILGVPALYWLGTIVTSRVEAIAATGLLAVSYHHIWFSQNARGYTALLFWAVVATALAVRIAERARTRDAALYGVVVALGTYTHLTMGFVLVAHAVVAAVALAAEDSAHRAKHTRVWALAFVWAGFLGAALYLPLVAQVYTFFGASPEGARNVATPSWAVLEVLKGLRVGLGAVGVLLALGLIAAGAASYARERPLVPALFLGPMVTTLGGILAMGVPLRPRFFFLLLGFGLLMLTRGAMEAGRLAARWRSMPEDAAVLRTGLAVTALIAAASAASLPSGYRLPKQDFEGAMRLVERGRAPSEPVATAGLASYPFARYYQKPWPPIVRLADLEDLARSGRRVWLVYSFPEYMDPDLVEGIRRDCTPRHVLAGSVGGGDIIVCTVDRAIGFRR